MRADWSMGSHGWAQGTAPQVPSLVCRLQALPGLRVGLHWGPTPFHPGTCLLLPGYSCQGAPVNQCPAIFSPLSASLPCLLLPKFQRGRRRQGAGVSVLS